MNDTKEITTHEPKDMAHSPTPMEILASAMEKGIDADQLSKLMDLQERHEAKEAKREFENAMADFQAKCPTIAKSKRADRYNYAPLDTVLRTIRPHMERCGLSVRFSTFMTGDSVITAVCTVSHRSGHSETSEFAATIDSQMKVNNTQKIGSANSYAKRYALMNALNLVGSDEDDDGYMAGEQLITDEQIVELNDFIDASGADRDKFLKFYGVEIIDQLPESKFKPALIALKLKMKKEDKA